MLHAIAVILGREHIMNKDKVYLRGGVIRDYVERRNSAQRKLASRLGMSPGHLSNLVNRRRPAGAASRRRLMDGLKLEFDTLFEVVPASADPRPTRQKPGNDNGLMADILDHCPAANRADHIPPGHGTGGSGNDDEEKPTPVGAMSSASGS
jgi:transcriptional regulator with XRE-family HTH domain